MERVPSVALSGGSSNNTSRDSAGAVSSERDLILHEMEALQRELGDMRETLKWL